MEIKVNSKSSINDFDKLTITKNSDNTYNVVVEKDLTDMPKLIGVITIPKVRFKDYEIIAESLSSDERCSCIPTTFTVINEKIKEKGEH